jgi:hypothetical protein
MEEFMRTKWGILFFACSFIGVGAFAETGGTGAGTPTQVAPAQPGGSNVIQTFDRGFFDKITPQPGSPDAQYTSEQYNEWVSQCEGEKAKSMQDFRNCFNGKKEKTLGQLKERRIEVEAKQQMPLSNTPQVMQDYKGLPSDGD